MLSIIERNRESIEEFEVVSEILGDRGNRDDVGRFQHILIS